MRKEIKITRVFKDLSKHRRASKTTSGGAAISNTTNPDPEQPVLSCF
jgi:hypothetical protein